MNENHDPKTNAVLEADINLELRPVWEMLDHYKTKRRAADWGSFVERTRTSILNHPHEYLTVYADTNGQIRKAIHVVFEEYIRSGFY